MSITLTHALLKAAAPPGITVDTVGGTDHLYSDGDTIGAIARIETAGNPSVYVWPNGRLWNRDWVYPAAVATWIAACRAPPKPQHETPDTNSSTTSNKSDVVATP